MQIVVNHYRFHVLYAIVAQILMLNHFNCTSCNCELDSTAREVKSRPGFAANDMNELYCLRCHDKMGIPICGACRRPIEERVVTALGKHWHVEHFVCAKCEKPFLGHRHYEKRGLAYCETHYHQLFGNLCFVCNQVIGGDGKLSEHAEFMFFFSSFWLNSCFLHSHVATLSFVYSFHRFEQGLVCASFLMLCV